MQKPTGDDAREERRTPPRERAAQREEREEREREHRSPAYTCFRKVGPRGKTILDSAGLLPSQSSMLRSDEHPDAAVAGTLARLGFSDRLRAHVAIMRLDHWIKNVFMLVGVLVAFFYHPSAFRAATLGHVTLGLVSVCLIASSNLRAERDPRRADRSSHFTSKRHRPIPSGRVWVPGGVRGMGGARRARLGPRRSREPAFSLVGHHAPRGVGLSPQRAPGPLERHSLRRRAERGGVNQPALRLALGWFTVVRHEYPPLCLLLVYWIIGAFFKASKRFAEYRSIGDPSAAAAYNAKSFAHYNEERLLLSMFFYAVTFALFLGIFTIRYHVELVLIFPLATGLVCHYLHVAFKKDSACQNPERLYRERGLMGFVVVCVVAFVVLMFVRIPLLYTLFNVTPSPVSPLWTF